MRNIAQCFLCSLISRPPCHEEACVRSHMQFFSLSQPGYEAKCCGYVNTNSWPKSLKTIDWRLIITQRLHIAHSQCTMYGSMHLTYIPSPQCTTIRTDSKQTHCMWKRRWPYKLRKRSGYFGGKHKTVSPHTLGCIHTHTHTPMLRNSWMNRCLQFSHSLHDATTMT